jgi:hypothetical protein
MNILNSDPNRKENAFREYLLARNPSLSFANKYIAYMQSSVIKRITYNTTKLQSVYMVNSLDTLYDIYEEIKLDDANIRLHNVYSGVISAYIKFLSGKEMRKRVSPKTSNQ